MSNIIELDLVPTRCMFPKVYNPTNDFYIYSCKTDSNEVELNERFRTITIKGKMQRLDLESSYHAEIEFAETHPTYGTSYNVVSIYQEMPKTAEAQKDYLRALVTENQLTEIFKVYPNEDIIELFKTDKFDYNKVKGIGQIVYERVKRKIVDNLEYQELISCLGKYGVTYDTIVKLMKEFGSAEIAIQKVKENAYILTKIHGIGFKKADAIARYMAKEEIDLLLKSGSITKEEAAEQFVKKFIESPYRIQSAIKHIIEQEQGSGHTYIEREQLLTSGAELLQIEINLIDKQINGTDNVYVEGSKVALLSTYETEEYISDWIKDRLTHSTELNFDVEDFIKRMEEKHKINLSEQQKSFFHSVKSNNVNLLVGFAGCVDQDTEFFNGERWKKISEYIVGDRVLQYNKDGSAELVEPLKYHKIPETKMTLMKTKSGSINQCLSDEHTVVYKTSKGHLADLPFSEVAIRNNANGAGFNGKFITTFDYDGTGISLSDEEIRVMVMVMADGSFPKGNVNSNYCRVNIKKDRKKERIIKLLNDAKIPFQSFIKDNDYMCFTFQSPLKSKKYESMWYECSKSQLKVVIDEVLLWDGAIGFNRKSFTSTEKESADFIQFAFSSMGYRATIYTDDRVGQEYKTNNKKFIRKSISYNVVISTSKLISLIARTPDKKTVFEVVRPVDGYKYCFTLPSGMWVMRREDRICITGNCGKSKMQNLLKDLLRELGKTAKWCAPTGNAAKILSGYIGEKASTVHKAIGYGQHKEVKDLIEILEDYVIIDESSMLDVFIASSILRKIKNPETRILFIGDNFQIPSVSAGNLLHDMIESGIVPLTKLDIVFRQSEGGILDISTRIRLNQKFIKDDCTERVKFGNDMIIHCVDQEWMVDGYKHYYNNFLKTHKPEEIMVLSPTKKGNLGTITINKEIQKIVNPYDINKKEIEFSEDGVLRVGDFIINIKNTYDIKNTEGETTEIVNGDKGLVYDILTDWKPEKKSRTKDSYTYGIDLMVNEDEEDEVVDLNGIYIHFDLDDIQLTQQEKFQLLHAWCLTMHKAQGGNAKAVLVIADKSHKWQLSANLLYTACTRATGFAVIVCQAEVLNYAMKKVENLRRQTFLEGLLRS